MYRNDFEAEEEVFAEATVRHHFREIAIGGGEEAHVNAARGRLSDAGDLAVFEHTQQLDL